MDASTKGTGELIADALDDFLTLLRKELELLRFGFVEGMADRLKGAGLLAGSVLVVLPGLLLVFVALALWFPGSPAVGFFVLGVALLAAAAVAIAFGVRLVRSGGGESTAALNKVKEDARWARERLTR